MLNNVLQWHDELWKRFAEMRPRMPHAILLHGPAGTGKFRLAEDLAKAMLCENSQNNRLLACGTCAACNWFAAGNHPDFRLVQPEVLAEDSEEPNASDAESETKRKASKQIKIQQIRDLESFINSGSHRGGSRVILLYPAETMNSATANALLKGLEEPSSGLVFILVSNLPQRLLPTVRSRCHLIAMPKPSREMSVHWLKAQGSRIDAAALAFAGDAPLDAALQDPEQIESRNRLFDLLGPPSANAFGLADYCQRLPPNQVVEWMLKWTYDLVALSSGGKARYCIDRDRQLGLVARSGSRLAYLKLFSYLVSLKGISEHPLNPRLFFDDMFFYYKQLA